MRLSFAAAGELHPACHQPETPPKPGYPGPQKVRRVAPGGAGTKLQAICTFNGSRRLLRRAPEIEQIAILLGSAAAPARVEAPDPRGMKVAHELRVPNDEELEIALESNSAGPRPIASSEPGSI